MKWRTLATALAASMPAIGLGCGACVEDKVAATYDHRAVARAAAAGDVVVFCEIIGALSPRAGARLKAVARRVRGVDARSVHVSTQPAALSFAMNPKLQTPQAVVDAVQRETAGGSRLVIIGLLLR